MTAATTTDSLDLDKVVSLEVGVRLVIYVAVSFLALLIYDWVISLEREVVYVWCSRWGLVKILYLINRYSPFVDVVIAVQERLDPNPSTCSTQLSFTTIFAGFGIGISALILMLRTYWMYNKSRKILALFTFSWIAISAACIWAIFRYTHSFQSGEQLPSSDSQSSLPSDCYLMSASLIGLVCFISLLAGETVVMALTIWKAFDAYRHQGYRYADLVNVVYREGIMFYMLIYPFTVANVVLLFAYSEGPEATALNLPLRVLHSILSGQLVIHVRAVTEEICAANSESPELLPPIVIEVPRHSLQKDDQMYNI